MCCGIDANPKDSIFLDKRGAGIQPRLGKPSGSTKGNIDGKIILSGQRRGMLFPIEVECIF